MFTGMGSIEYGSRIGLRFGLAAAAGRAAALIGWLVCRDSDVA